MFKQLCKQHFPIILFQQPIFTSKTYDHAVTYNQASAHVNLRILRHKTIPYGAVTYSLFRRDFAILLTTDRKLLK